MQSSAKIFSECPVRRASDVSSSSLEAEAETGDSFVHDERAKTETKLTSTSEMAVFIKHLHMEDVGDHRACRL
jgi:hypothetical protein